MRKTFEPIDDLLIERLFQPVLDMVAHRTGLSRPAACCFCVDMASLAWIVSRVRELSDAIGKWDPGSAFVDIAILMLGLVALVCCARCFGGLGTNRPIRCGRQCSRIGRSCC